MAWITHNTLSTCGLRLEAPHKDNMCRSIVDNRTSVKSNISNKLRNLGLKIFQKNLKNTLRYSGTYLNAFINTRCNNQKTRVLCIQFITRSSLEHPGRVLFLTLPEPSFYLGDPVNGSHVASRPGYSQKRVLTEKSTWLWHPLFSPLLSYQDGILFLVGLLTNVFNHEELKNIIFTKVYLNGSKIKQFMSDKVVKLCSCLQFHKRLQN